MSHGLLAEFEKAEDLVEAADRARAEGYRRLDAFSPFPVEGLDEALGLRPTRLPWIVFAGGAAGAVGGYALQYWASVIDYPLDVGGRPPHSWPAFIVVSFELAILGAAVAAAVGMLALNGLPRPHHPVFDAPRFALASQNRFFLCIEARDPKYDPAATRAFLESLRPAGVVDVPS